MVAEVDLVVAGRHVLHVVGSYGEGLCQALALAYQQTAGLAGLAAARDLKPPVYEVVSRTGAHHAPRFAVRVSVARLGDATAEGTSKQEAETAAAAALLSQLK